LSVLTTSSGKADDLLTPESLIIVGEASTERSETSKRATSDTRLIEEEEQRSKDENIVNLYG